MLKADKVIIGAGIYGLYSALFCARKNEKVIVLEYDDEAISRATYINQARVHNGYHYPRSYSTAIKSAKYFNRFNNDFSFAINKDFLKVYATSKEYSWTNAKQFRKFCRDSNIKCEELNPLKYFKANMCDGTFETEEYTFDAMLIKDFFIKELKKYSDVQIIYSSRISKIETISKKYHVFLKDGLEIETGFILNSTYGSTNQILDLMGYDKFKIKYEICEILLCEVSSNIKDVGLTVMDGPFFSLMPFGKTGLHSLTSVTFTPHITSYEELPTFECQNNTDCSPSQLGNCNICQNKPKTAWTYMYALAKKYLNEDISINYVDSLFSVKPILKASEIDDSRPTVIRQHSSSPEFYSVLSGKINTIYDLEEILK